jgi:uncharacterized membrane protein HdeD (DUF308 family)
MIERFRSPVMQGMKTMAISSMDALGHDVERHRMWLVALGASLILLGIVAVASSLATTYASMLVLAGILLVGAVIRVVASFTAREWTGSLLLILSGVLYFVAAVLTFRHPIAAALALTLLFRPGGIFGAVQDLAAAAEKQSTGYRKGATSAGIVTPADRLGA